MPWTRTGEARFDRGSPGIGELRIVGNALYAVGDQGVVVNGFVERHTVMAKWTGPLSVPNLAAETIGLYPNPATDGSALNSLHARQVISGSWT